MFIGCLPIASLRLSTLECFYNQTCLNGIQQILDSQNISIINSLDRFASSQYSIETTLNDIIDYLMLEEWTYRINYTSYFNTCNLKKCTYSIMKTKNPLVIFMSLLGLCKWNTILNDSIDFLCYTNRWWINYFIEMPCTSSYQNKQIFSKHIQIQSTNCTIIILKYIN